MKDVSVIEHNGYSDCEINNKIVVILGSTGTGKSKLGIDIAKAFNGEIINADAMQLYDGLDIGTAKVTPEETEGVPHHLLSVLIPGEITWTVKEFRDHALEIIKDIHLRGKLPVIVGGTNYYIQALVWKSGGFMDSTEIEVKATESIEENSEQDLDKKQDNEGDNIDVVAGVHFHEELKKVDPIMALRLHPNDLRRIKRSLEIFQTTGKQHSTLIQEQADQSQYLTELRYPQTHMFWIDSEWEVLRPRLSKRVDVMIKKGLIGEIKELRNRLSKTKEQNKNNLKEEDTGIDSTSNQKCTDEESYITTGLLQAIGFKEFEPYFVYIEENYDKEDELEVDEKGKEILAACIEKVKVNTYRYAKKQTQWIRNRIMPLPISITKLDSSQVEKWDDNVFDIASNLVKDLLEGKLDTTNLKRNTSNSSTSGGIDTEKWKKYDCELCNISRHGIYEWEVHLKSRQHKSQKSKKRKKEMNFEKRKQSGNLATIDIKKNDSSLEDETKKCLDSDNT